MGRKQAEAAAIAEWAAEVETLERNLADAILVLERREAVDAAFEATELVADAARALRAAAVQEIRPVCINGTIPTT